MCTYFIEGFFEIPRKLVRASHPLGELRRGHKNEINTWRLQGR
jgi:hypothetical protein